MKKIILILFKAFLFLQLPAQNLVVNPGAESLPRGTGWTIVSSGALTCLSAPTTNYLNWTMKPDGTANYPYDHTTGANGGTVFFSGCDTYFTGPFELQQTIDVSADAAIIDLGNQLYTFSGYMQTPVNNQSDQGRYIVDFLNAANTILGTSYTTAWQSYFGGSGTSWIYYNDTRIAPAGTRKIKIRMQTEIHFNQPAINVYFDDISLTKPSILPVNLISFTGTQHQDNIDLNWEMTGASDLEKFELEKSTDGSYFHVIAILQAGKNIYQFTDAINDNSGKYFYRLKMTGTNGKITYSKIVVTKITNHPLITISPNPANDEITINGLLQNGNLSIISADGNKVFFTNTNAAAVKLSVSGFPAGLYTLRFSNQKTIVNKKLFIYHY